MSSNSSVPLPPYNHPPPDGPLREIFLLIQILSDEEECQKVDTHMKQALFSSLRSNLTWGQQLASVARAAYQVRDGLPQYFIHHSNGGEALRRVTSVFKDLYEQHIERKNSAAVAQECTRVLRPLASRMAPQVPLYTQAPQTPLVRPAANRADAGDLVRTKQDMGLADGGLHDRPRVPKRTYGPSISFKPATEPCLHKTNIQAYISQHFPQFLELLPIVMQLGYASNPSLITLFCALPPQYKAACIDGLVDKAAHLGASDIEMLGVMAAISAFYADGNTSQLG
ncbi:hypothetical protein BJ165DRAFT_1411226 [Panaeolus papilionaceus]|nr:hypothetical protein BJ165DRAFT_1411226 [Panaeolus papilionaceus]